MDARPLTAERWPDFVELLERRGPRGGRGPVHCCCMWWRERRDHDANRAGMERLVREGREPGLLAYEEGRAVAWVSIAPREQHGQLVRSRTYAPTEEESGVWSIVCFYLQPAARHRGMSAALLDAAVEHAAARGATAVEAYPHNRGDYMGSIPLFQAAGFERVRPAGPRTIMRRNFPTPLLR